MSFERFDYEEAGRLLDSAGAVFGELKPSVEQERDELGDLISEEVARRDTSWRRLTWFWWLTHEALDEQDERLLRSATTAIRLASREEFERRSWGEADSR